MSGKSARLAGGEQSSRHGLNQRLIAKRLHCAALLRTVRSRTHCQPMLLADELLSSHGLHLLALDRSTASTPPSPDASHPHGLLRLTVQPDPPAVVACRGRGVLAADHGRHEHCRADTPRSRMTGGALFAHGFRRARGRPWP